MSFLSRIARKPIDIVEHKVDKLKTQVKEEMGQAISKIAFVMVMMVVLCFAVLFASICLALYLNEVMESELLGYLTVSLIYVGVFILLFLVRNKNIIFQKMKEFTQYLFGGQDFL
ncbi:phage holin family protein [Fulvivirga sediminis]|uniref:Phage holin family protein n=1 Tax=Fulvivirga sediminis TaxID=2803949 RepID=A0A937F7C4_9BACT|nr:phage holin family protein [Fulvivirga sediminis]MBL3657782.1 phage holin family protein [Fulvivirga sediminis]